ncbi:hypothetical protein Ahy_B03g064911 [Arachis hypogaea]|uniref:Replication protein A 70 kDa DNA-binding subunit B/D first OB fold domain-containing protein n=1 Tax=Arachis hypogaea TaxID=3818 RepID=A0A445A0I7_ARAHY|nr:hypothetical protein Ahy_B03g064911 [Arachis hypogaea]
MWRVPSYGQSNSNPLMELVMLDKEGSQIHCLIRSFHYHLFEPIVEEGKVYVLANFTIDSNTLKFKPTKHDMRIIFKRDTLVSRDEETYISIEFFQFFPTKDIITSARDEMYLIDIIGLLSAKSDLIPFEKKVKKSHYVKNELDDLRCHDYHQHKFTTKILVNPDLEVVKKFRQRSQLMSRVGLLSTLIGIMHGGIRHASDAPRVLRH